MILQVEGVSHPSSLTSRFHTSYGAKVLGLVPGYRPEVCRWSLGWGVIGWLVGWLVGWFGWDDVDLIWSDLIWFDDDDDDDDDDDITLDLPRPASGKENFRLGFPRLIMFHVILVVTGILGCGGRSKIWHLSKALTAGSPEKCSTKWESGRFQ